jgi:hypothetical protein
MRVQPLAAQIAESVCLAGASTGVVVCARDPALGGAVTPAW